MDVVESTLHDEQLFKILDDMLMLTIRSKFGRYLTDELMLELKIDLGITIVNFMQKQKLGRTMYPIIVVDRSEKNVTHTRIRFYDPVDAMEFTLRKWFDKYV